jgi:hypothetical protein
MRNSEDISVEFYTDALNRFMEQLTVFASNVALNKYNYEIIYTLINWLTFL